MKKIRFGAVLFLFIALCLAGCNDPNGDLFDIENSEVLQGGGSDNGDNENPPPTGVTIVSSP